MPKRPHGDGGQDEDLDRYLRRGPSHESWKRKSWDECLTLNSDDFPVIIFVDGAQTPDWQLGDAKSYFVAKKGNALYIEQDDRSMCTHYVKWRQRQGLQATDPEMWANGQALFFFGGSDAIGISGLANYSKSKPAQSSKASISDDDAVDQPRVLVLCQRRGSTDEDAALVRGVVSSLEHLIRAREPNAVIEYMTSGLISPNFEADYKFQLGDNPESNRFLQANEQQYAMVVLHTCGLDNMIKELPKVASLLKTDGVMLWTTVKDGDVHILDEEQFEIIYLRIEESEGGNWCDDAGFTLVRNGEFVKSS